MKLPDVSSLSAKIGLAALSGVLSILIFPFFDLEFLAWTAFVPLFVAIQQANRQRAFWLGWLAGWIHFMGTLYWVTVTMVLYGGMSTLLSGLLLVVMAVYLALYFAIFCVGIRAAQSRTGLPLIAIAPVWWVGLEYLRSFFFIGFPWNLLGYSQFKTPYITQIADITGVYGVSFLIILVNAGLYDLCCTSLPRRTKYQVAAAFGICVAGCLGYSVYRLSEQSPVASDHPNRTVSVAVVQGNIPQDIKWDKEHQSEIIATYFRLSKRVNEQHPDLIVWPETSVPYAFRYDFVHHDELIQTVREWKTPLLFGGVDFEPVPTPEKYYSFNSAFLLSADGTLLAKYDKIHLVPFGEYVPFEKILFFVEKLTDSIGKNQPGKEYTVMTVNGMPFSTVICFEVIFPNLVRKFVDNGAQFLVTITNDAWFGKTAATYQHFAMVTFRAIENHVAIARAANTGISGFIDPYGRILKQSEIFVEDAFVQKIPVKDAAVKTFYSRYGDVFAIVCFIVTAAWIVILVVKKPCEGCKPLQG